VIYSEWNGFKLSRLMLGTVQFGMPYGIANRTGQPNFEDIVAIVSAAVEGGVTCFDTAAAYGCSEEVLGRVLHALAMVGRVIVVTKVRALTPEELDSPTMAERAIIESVAESRRRLMLDCLPIVLFHRESDAAYMETLFTLREKGWISHCGVSCDNRPGPAARFIADDMASALQVPANILDRRHSGSGVFEQAQSKNVAIFIRSVYLQGLLVMPEDQIPRTLQPIIPARRALSSLADEAGMSLAELALRYMLSQPGVTSVLTGVETIQQVHENLAMFARGRLTDDVLAAIDRTELPLAEQLLTPAQWAR